jgi:methylglutaconyl-CoA hydratase
MSISWTSAATYNDIRYETGAGDANGIAKITIARPEVRNAFDAEMIAGLHATFDALSGERPERLRAVVLAGEGPIFCAGADVAWQRASLALSYEENLADAGRLFDMLTAIDRCPVPVITRVHGAALGGGMGLCAVSDVVLSTADARFGFTETKLGILPAVIAPFVVAKIGESQARALYPTGQRFEADRAQRAGLVHEVLADEAALDARVAEVIGELLSAGPSATRAAKAVIRRLRQTPEQEARDLVVEIAAKQRVSPEGQEGLGAFLEKRRASWRVD